MIIKCGDNYCNDYLKWGKLSTILITKWHGEELHSQVFTANIKYSRDTFMIWWMVQQQCSPYFWHTCKYIFHPVKKNNHFLLLGAEKEQITKKAR